MAVEVVLAVGRVGAAVQALAVVAVGHRRLDHELVVRAPGRCSSSRPSTSGAGSSGRPLSVTACSTRGRRSTNVDAPGVRLVNRIVVREPNSSAPTVEVEVDVDRVDGDQGGPGGRLGAGQ